MSKKYYGKYGTSIVSRSKERGVVLLIALIVLVAMTLAGIALIRSTSTTNLIAGNLAFSQVATSAGDIGAERAFDFLVKPSASLDNDILAGGYSAVALDPNVGESWDAFWIRMEAANRTFPKPAQAAIGDAAGNQINYMIHRLCDATGPANSSSVRCVRPPKLSSTGGSQDSGSQLIMIPQVYYRVVVRITGPRNTLSYIQTVIAM